MHLPVGGEFLMSIDGVRHSWSSNRISNVPPPSERNLHIFYSFCSCSNFTICYPSHCPSQQSRDSPFTTSRKRPRRNRRRRLPVSSARTSKESEPIGYSGFMWPVSSRPAILFSLPALV